VKDRKRSFDGRFASGQKAVSADEAHAAKQLELASRETDCSQKGATVKLHPLFSAYLAHLERKGRDQKTIARNRCSLVRLNSWLNEAGIDPLYATEVVLEEYVAWVRSTLADTTASRETTHLKAAFRYAVRLETLKHDPAAHIEVPAVTEVEPLVYSHEELRRIRAAMRTDLEEAIYYGLAYGCLRRHELVELRWDAVDFEQQFLTIRGKGGKLRRVPLHPLLAEIFATRRRRYPYDETVLGRGGSMRNVNTVIARLLERAGVDGGNRPAHRFRKTAATSLYEEEVQPDKIDRIFGWAKTTIRSRYYTRIGDRALYDAILKLYASDPIERPPLRIINREAGIGRARVDLGPSRPLNHSAARAAR
jgi:integrase/recombinase XerD